MNANKQKALADRIKAVDALAARKRKAGLSSAADRAVGRAEGLREARDLFLLEPDPPLPALTSATVPYDEITDPTQALLWFADEGHYEGTYRKGAGFVDALGLGIARRVLGLAADRPDRSLMPLTEALAARAAQSPVLTPEVVLRAMLTANEAAALDKAIVHMRAPLYSEYESLASDEADSRAAHVRDVVAAFVAGKDWRMLLSSTQEDDYEARLAGTRPLDAPPLEVP